jgi:MOSC domain-containing protein
VNGARVTGLLVTPVKGLRVTPRDDVRVGPSGVLENRRFFLVDETGAMISGKRLSKLQRLIADYSHDDRELSLRFPDDRVVSGPVRSGAMFAASFYDTAIPAVEVEGPWSDALSELVGARVRLVESGLRAGAVDRGRVGAISLISRATLARVARAAGTDGEFDGRRFRMLFEIDGVAEHEEDGWLERRVAVGDAVVRVRGHVGRCVVTTRNPDSGRRDVDTLGALATYRRTVATTEPLACGVFGEVIGEGRVRVGDAVRLVED